jgi:hypothetical protein
VRLERVAELGDESIDAGGRRCAVDQGLSASSVASFLDARM